MSQIFKITNFTFVVSMLICLSAFITELIGMLKGGETSPYRTASRRWCSIPRPPGTSLIWRQCYPTPWSPRFSVSFSPPPPPCCWWQSCWWLSCSLQWTLTSHSSVDPLEFASLQTHLSSDKPHLTENQHLKIWSICEYSYEIFIFL